MKREDWLAVTFRAVALGLMGWTLHEVVELGKSVAVLQAQVQQLQALVARILPGG